MDNKGLEFGFIGLGQAGGNIANEFAKKNYKVIAINTSQTDLELLNSIYKSNKLLINVGIQGAGKNPEIGENALEEHIETVYNLIEKVFSSPKDHKIDKLFICGGMGGGTASGMMPLLCTILTEQGYDIGIITTLPGETESPRTKLVALSTYEKITGVVGITNVFVIDNKKASERIPQISLSSKYSFLNSSIAKQIDNINIMATKPSLTSFDARELQTVLSARGLSIINQITIEDINELKNETTLSSLLEEAIKTSLFSNMKNIEVNAAVFLFEFPKGGNRYINEEAMKKMQETVGDPFDTFYGIYESDNNSSKMGTLTILLTGIDFNNVTRLEDIQKSFEKKEKIYEEMLKKKNDSFSGNGSSLLEKFSNNNKVQETKKEGLSTLAKLRQNKKK